MRRRTSLTAALSIGTAFALASCGIPTGKAPEVIDDAPTDFDSSSGAAPETFAPTTDAEETVENFLKAVSGDPASRDDRLNIFTANGDAQYSEPGDGIRLIAGLEAAVRDTGDLETATVNVTGSVVGTYLQDGLVRMNPTPAEYDETFTLQREGFQDSWLMTSLPLQAALDYDYFREVYVQAPMYFQAGQAQLLVPDLRWIYRELEVETRRRLLLDWLILGPSDFASQSASTAIPPGTTTKTSTEDGVVQIELLLGTTVEDDDARDAIAAQVAWSLGLDGEFVLSADGATLAEGTLTDWRRWNAIPEALPETAYFIADDTVWEYAGDQQVTQTSPDHSWVGFSADGLQQVAVGPGDRIAAITTGPDGEVLQTGTSAAVMRAVTGLSGNLTDPQWLDDDTVIVVDGGVPTAVMPEPAGTQALAAAGDQVTAMALAADGRRLAYVQDGLAWVAPLGLDTDGNISVGEPRQLGLGIENATDVAWSSENSLWVVGDRNDDQLFRVAIDNSRIEPQKGTGAFPQISQIAANPADPVESNSDRGEPVIIVANSTLYRLFTDGPDEVRNGDEPVAGTAPFTVLQ
ncbi:MAG TPA: LpqB family beta-propeller domain-containing protein [Glycomyces sp.]|nr:LpqB family beta-propeller domain-containing protein [Glycomyces sp.]